MRFGVQLARRIVGTSVLILVVVGTVGYVIYAANGILDEVEARDMRDRHDALSIETATSLALPYVVDDLLAADQSYDWPSIAVVAVQPTAAPNTATPFVDDTAQVTDAPVPTDGDHLPAPPETRIAGTANPDAMGDGLVDATPASRATETTGDSAIFAANPPDDAPVDTSLQVSTETPTVTPSLTPTLTSTPTITPSPVPPTPTLIPTNTPRATATLIPTNTPRVTWTPEPTDTLVPSETPTAMPSATWTPTQTWTPTPTYTPTREPSPTYVIEGTYAVPLETPVVPIPERIPLMEDSDDIINILLLGSDTTSSALGRTDVMIIVSINKVAGSVAMWHLPRDLFVYIPNYTMDRLNRAYMLGAMSEYPGGGFGLLRETILYNFGIHIDHYARVDFNDYMAIVERLGGLDVSVDCAIQDWRLKDPELDATVEDNWEIYTMPIGRQVLDPYMALWYVRSRKTTNDLDRGRRQMDVLRAMWQQARKQGLFTQVTQLWPEAVEIIETDMSLTDVLGFVPLAVSLDMSNIARYSGTQAARPGPGVHYVSFKTPDDGREVSLPNYDQLVPLIENFLTPPTANRLGRQALTVDIYDASAFYLGFDQVAADRLAWEGFSVRAMGIPDSGTAKELTTIVDYTGETKGSALDDLKRVLRITDSQVAAQPNANRSVDFRVEIGGAYNSCVYGNAEDEIAAGPPVDEE